MVLSGRCAKHRVEVRRPTIDEQGYGSDWRAIRDEHIRANPLCVECAARGASTKGMHVDHIVPWKGNDALRLDRTNLQTLCHSHHSRKTAAEDGGFGNPRRLA